MEVKETSFIHPTFLNTQNKWKQIFSFQYGLSKTQVFSSGLCWSTTWWNQNLLLNVLFVFSFMLIITQSQFSSNFWILLENGHKLLKNIARKFPFRIPGRKKTEKITEKTYLLFLFPNIWCFNKIWRAFFFFFFFFCLFLPFIARIQKKSHWKLFF